jgi:alpha-tubulin suppressor-like RCC1 family protein
MLILKRYTTTSRNRAVTALGIRVCLTACALSALGCGGGVRPGAGDKLSRLAQPGTAPVAIGAGFACVRAVDRRIYCWGVNSSNSLGYTNPSPDDPSFRASPVAVAGVAPSGQVAAGGEDVCARVGGGRLSCWGNNGGEHLGNGFVGDISPPADVVGLTRAAAVAAGAGHMCVRKQGGAAYCWGNNAQGELGDGTTTDRIHPTPVRGLSKGVIRIFAGSLNTCAILMTGSVRCMGDNQFGQLGARSQGESTIPVKVRRLPLHARSVAVGTSFTCALSRKGAVFCWGQGGRLGDGRRKGSRIPVRVIGLPKHVVQLSSGGADHACALTAGGRVYCWGGNQGGVLGDGTTHTRLRPVRVKRLGGHVESVAVGDGGSCVTTTSRAVKCWGPGEMDGGFFSNGHRLPVRIPGLRASPQVGLP